ncbi:MULTISPECIES: hypothetical protein [unclassified Pseudomonas]|uniref:hypothetical protein n=1 Tax=unclassified Pseudomonas TaxID=196821 RepID=UPI00244AD986|nr:MULTISPECIES: hypothetical protein [unclassified Pseudomonas]MDG9927442.1 hypothetical protein [Pseudomonas sp. GD04042]MDH0482511.1 hypothetical protein [Pseudomonas sp. GD04015]MDH0602863.1 hypothetical protein [Pseudomonas sp. GD03869]
MLFGTPFQQVLYLDVFFNGECRVAYRAVLCDLHLVNVASLAMKAQTGRAGHSTVRLYLSLAAGDGVILFQVGLLADWAYPTIPNFRLTAPLRLEVVLVDLLAVTALICLLDHVYLPLG